MVKNLPANAGDAGSVLELGRFPGGRNGNLFPGLLPEASHGQRNLADRNPWGHKELDTTKQLSTHKGWKGIQTNLLEAAELGSRATCTEGR